MSKSRHIVLETESREDLKISLVPDSREREQDPQPKNFGLTKKKTPITASVLGTSVARKTREGRNTARRFKARLI